MSRAGPTLFICVGLLVSSRRIVAPLAPCLSLRFPSSVHISLLRRGVSPCVWSHTDPWESCGGSTYIALHRTWLVSSFLPGAFSALVVFCLLCGIPPVFMAIIWSVSLTPACPLRVTPVWGCSLDTCMACDWLALLSSSTFFQASVICADFWSRQCGPHTACDRLR